MENTELELAIIRAIMNDSANINTEDENEEEQNTI